jgi:hypothetical protein
MFSLGDKDGNRTIRARSLPAVDRLNDLWRLPGVPDLTIDAARPDRAVIRNGRTVLLEVLPGDTSDGEVAAEARRLRDRITDALKSRPTRKP